MIDVSPLTAHIIWHLWEKDMHPKMRHRFALLKRYRPSEVVSGDKPYFFVILRWRFKSDDCDVTFCYEFRNFHTERRLREAYGGVPSLNTANVLKDPTARLVECLQSPAYGLDLDPYRPHPIRDIHRKMIRAWGPM